MPDVPGGASGMLGRDYMGKGADWLVTRIAPGTVSLVAALRGHERHAAEELGQWKTHYEVRKAVVASPAAVTVALLLTDEELDAARHGEPAQVFPANAAAADGRPGLDGVICWSRIGAVRSKFTIRRFSIANRQAKDLVAEGEHLPDQLSRNLAVGQLETNKTLPSEVGRSIISPER